MISAVAQRLAEALVQGTSLHNTEQIDFNHPSHHCRAKPGLSIYCYDIRENSQVTHLHWQIDSNLCQINNSRHNLLGHSPPIAKPFVWFDLSFLISAWDGTIFGEQRLLSETLMLLVRQSARPEMTIPLSGEAPLKIRLATVSMAEAIALWTAFRAPFRPAVYVTITSPFTASEQPQIYAKVGRRKTSSTG